MIDTTVPYRRARVAITFAGFCLRPDFIHMGHARTLLLGSMIAEGLGVPFHVRCDDQLHSHCPDPDPSALAASVIDLTECVRFLEINAERIYWQPKFDVRDARAIEDLGSEAVYFFTALNHPRTEAEPEHKALLVDDVIHWYPSLVIRGMEFQMRRQEEYRRYETRAYLGAGRERYEVNVPLIHLDGLTLSKSQSHLIYWRELQAVSPEEARLFLVATAMKPLDPLSAVASPFDVAQMPGSPYEWDWDAWKTFCDTHGRSG